jgi:protocatechuate 3,4-dioxygenase beta subunit
MRQALGAIVVWAALVGGAVAAELPAPEAPDAAIVEPHLLEGQIVGSDGKPLQGAVVRFRPLNPDDEGAKAKAPPSIARTDQAGRFSSGVITGLRFELGVHAEGHAFWIDRDHDPSRPLVVSLKQGQPLTGQVLDMAGRGLAGMRVTLSDDRAFDLTGPEVTTDKEGTYRFPHAPSGAVWVRASAPGRATRSVQVRNPGGGKPAVDDLWLPEGGSISGSVMDAQGSPVAGASVWAAPLDNVGGAFSGRFPVVRVLSDEEGGFSLEGITAGNRYRVGAEAVDETRGASGPLSIVPGALLEDLIIRLHAAATLRLRLIDAEERPTERISMRFDSETENDDRGYVQRQTVEPDSDKLVPGEDGWWTVNGLQSGRFELRIEPDGYLEVRQSGIVLRDGETTEIGTLRLEPGSSLGGRVVDREGKPVGGAEVLARWRDLDHAVTLEARAEGFASSIVEEVSAGNEAVVVTVDEHGTIRGGVKLAEGGTSPSFSVRAVPRKRSRSASGDTDDDIETTGDSFEIRRLSPGGYSVEVRMPARVTARIDRVTVRAGETTDLGEISLKRGLGFRGRVVEGDGDTPVAGVRIRADRGAGPASWSNDPADATAVSSRDGSFTVDGLEATRYTVTLDHPGFAPLQRSVVLDDGRPLDPVVFGLTAGGTVTGTVKDGDDLPVAGAGIVLARAAGGYDVRTTSTRADGSYRISRLAPGHYILVRTGPTARAGLGNGMRTVLVREGEVTVSNYAR